MLIANPIYDIVFKRLMENERVAKFFIGTFLGNTVEELHVRPQEFTYAQSHAELPIPLRVFRLDFLAVVRMDDGSLRTFTSETQPTPGTPVTVDDKGFRVVQGQGGNAPRTTRTSG